MKEEAGFFKVLGDATRLRLAVLLAQAGETCVCILARALKEPEFKVSRHLAIMRSAGMVVARRQGTWMYYQLVPARSDLEKGLQACLRDCLAGHAAALADRVRLKSADCG